MLNTINAKLVFLSLISILFIALSVSFSYLIAVSSIKTLMESDVTSVADAMEKNLNYIATINPDAYKQADFKKMIYSIKIGKSGYPFMMDELGTLVVHPTQEGRNLAGQSHIDFIRNHKEKGILEYTAVTTGQQKIVAYRYIDKWNLWIVPGVNKADYFYQLKSSFLKWNLIFGVAIITILAVTSSWINRTVTKPLKGMLRIFANMGGNGTGSPAQSGMNDSRETRETVCRLLENLLFSKHSGSRR
jgi:methyl-accepting chemotaxis protein